FNWSWDPFGRRVTETSPLYQRCHGPSGPDDGVNLSPDCGVVVQAMILPMRDNPLLARTLQVGVVDQAQGYESLMATERQLEQMEQQRRAAEAASAAQQADKPTLQETAGEQNDGHDPALPRAVGRRRGAPV